MRQNKCLLIYKITNKINGKCYVGQTTKSIEQRWKAHCWQCNFNNNMIIYRAIKKYGKENFSIEKICDCQNQKELNESEVKYIKYFDTMCPNGYNLCGGGGGTGIMSDIVKKKISKAHIGKKATPETREKLRISHLGFKVSDKTKRKLSKCFKGKKQPKWAVDKRIKATIKAVAKKYKLINPEGKIIHIFNMAEFCRNNKFSKSKMCELAVGKRKLYRGWKLFE